MSEARDYYEVLGVDRDADQKTIKRAFLKKARALHPDVSDDPDAEEKFKEVNEAYSVLSDEQKRSNYDRFGSADGAGFSDIGDIFGGMGMDDIFSTFFGGGSTRGGGGRKVNRTGRDMAIALTITLEEAALGCKKTISYDRLAPCDDCGGRGYAPGAKETTCGRCHGTGYVTTVQNSIFGQMQSTSSCPDCNGEGTVLDRPCEMCGGQGRVPSHEKIDVDVPAGIDHGRQLRVAGFGEAGYRGAKAGDLIVTIQVAPHERFERRGDDLAAEVHVGMAQAALGCTVEVEGIKPGELVQVEVPAGTQHGASIAVAGCGMPRLGGGGSRGRFIARIAVDIPKKLSSEERDLLEAFAELEGQQVNRRRSVGKRIRNAIDDMLD